MKKVLILSFFVVFSFVACKEKGEVIAKVGGADITDSSLKERLQTMPPAYQNYVNTSLGRKQFVDAIVREKIMIEAAKQAGVDKKSEYTDAVADFKREQARQLNEFCNGLLVERYLQDIQGSIVATDNEIEEYYNTHKAEYDVPVSYTVRHILVTSKEEAEKALARIEKGEKFEEVAQQVSQDTGSAANGGLIGPFKKGDLVPEFEKAALALQVNQMSGIVETNYGFHVILKVAEQKLPPVSFEQAKPEIKRTIEKEKFDKWFEGEKQKLGVTVDYDKALSVNLMPVSPSAQEVMPEDLHDGGHDHEHGAE